MQLHKSDLKRCAGKKLHNVPLDNVSLSIGKIFLQFAVYKIFATVCGFLLHKGFFAPIVANAERAICRSCLFGNIFLKYSHTTLTTKSGVKNEA